jgi:oxalate decarboxylase/phosphoglucose isomerase-like protein (cupin superfamily)
LENANKVKSNTVFDCTLLQLPRINTPGGNITSINNNIEIPFDIQRVYYLYDVPGGESRGGHAHKLLHQVIVAASGSFDLIVDDGRTKRIFHLARPYVGVYVPSGLWRELDNFSSGSICLVLASEKFDEGDYIRAYEEFICYRKDLL